jgi:hypothetical protein
MRIWQLDGSEIRSDAVAYSTATPASGLTILENQYLVGVGNNVLKYRQNEIWDLIEWLKDEAMAQMETTRFPRPAYGGTGGGTFFKASLIGTATGFKFSKTLVTSVDLTTVPITDENAVYWGYTVGTAALPVNDVELMGSGGMDRAWEEIKQYYIGSAQASA